jgi:hypothetical protein
MPVYTIQTPSGRTLDIQADTPDAAMAGAQQWHSQQQPSQQQQQAPQEGPWTAFQQQSPNGSSTPDLSTVTPDTVARARAAGYSDQEIVDHLTPSAPGKFNAALKAGYSPTEVLDYLAPQSSGVVDSLQQGVADVAGGVGKTLETHLGPGPVGNWLQGKATAIAPANYVPSPLVDKTGFHASGILPTLARAAPEAAGAVVAAGLAPEFLGAAGPIAAGAGAYAAMNAGNEDQQAATTRTGNPNATPSTGDVVRGDLSAAASGLVSALPIGRFLPGADPIAATGIKGVTAALKKLGVTSAEQGVASGASDAVNQVGQSIGTRGGVSVDPTEVANSAASGVAGGAVAGALPGARESLDAAKYGSITPDLQPAATQFANRMQQFADGAKIDAQGANLPFSVGSKQAAGEAAYNKATAAVTNELSDAVSDLRSRVTLPVDADNALKSVMSGQQPNARDYTTLQAAVAGDPQADNVMNLVRQAHVADLVGDTGYHHGGKFTGGVSGLFGHILTGEHIAKSAMVGAGAATFEEGAGHLIAYSPQVISTVAGLSALAKLADSVTGARSPAGRFVRNFADGTTPVRETVPAPQAAPSPSVPPTGPRISQAPTPWGSGTSSGPVAPAVATGSIITPQVRARMNALATLGKLKAANTPAPVQAPASVNPLALPKEITGPAVNLMRGAASANKIRQAQSVPQAEAPMAAINPMALPRTVTGPAANIMRGVAIAQKMRTAQQPVAPQAAVVNPLALPREVTGPAATIMRGATIAQRLKDANAPQSPQGTAQQPQPVSVSKAKDGTAYAETGPAKLPIAPYWSLPVPEAAQRILRDQLAANIPIKNSGAFLSKTIGILNTVRDKTQAVTQAVPNIPAVDVARFEGVKSQKAARDYRDHLKREYPQAAPVLDRVFSDDAIASQWVQKR